MGGGLESDVGQYACMYVCMHVCVSHNFNGYTFADEHLNTLTHPLLLVCEQMN